MKKLYKITLLILFYIILTTYSPNTIDSKEKKNSFFFKIKKIEVINNKLIRKEKIINRLDKLYSKNILFINNKRIFKIN